MFNFSSKKKDKSDDLKKDSSQADSGSIPDFNAKPPLPKSDAPNEKDINISQKNPEDDVSFEIPDFSDEDINLNLEAADDSPKDNNENLVDTTSIPKEVDINEAPAPQNNNDVAPADDIAPPQSNSNSSFGKIDIDSEKDAPADDDFSFDSDFSPDDSDSTKFEGESEGLDFSEPVEPEGVSGDVKEPESPNDEEADLPAFDVNEQEDSSSDEEFSFIPSDDVQEDTQEEVQEDIQDDFQEEVQEDGAFSAPDEEAEDTAELPTFDVAEEIKPIFISKPEYKKLILSVLHINENSKELTKEQSDFPKIENTLKKYTSEIQKDLSFYKENLIDIDKKIFV